MVGPDSEKISLISRHRLPGVSRCTLKFLVHHGLSFTLHLH